MLTDDVSTGGKIISIHALLAESDYLGAWKSCDVCRISIHALLAESDLCSSIFVFWTALFLSTLSLRRATANSRAERQEQHDFYPRSPCGERQVKYTSTGLNILISIHALLAESDLDR